MQACQVEQLLGSYGTELYRYCRRLAGFGPDGEDLYQQTFLRMLELDLAPDEGRNPRALLYSVATGLWRNEARKRSRRAAIARPVELDGDDPPRWSACRTSTARRCCWPTGPSFRWKKWPASKSCPKAR